MMMQLQNRVLELEAELARVKAEFNVTKDDNNNNNNTSSTASTFTTTSTTSSPSPPPLSFSVVHLPPQQKQNEDAKANLMAALQDSLEDFPPSIAEADSLNLVFIQGIDDLEVQWHVPRSIKLPMEFSPFSIHFFCDDVEVFHELTMASFGFFILPTATIKSRLMASAMSSSEGKAAVEAMKSEGRLMLWAALVGEDHDGKLSTIAESFERELRVNLWTGGGEEEEEEEGEGEKKESKVEKKEVVVEKKEEEKILEKQQQQQQQQETDDTVFSEEELRLVIPKIADLLYRYHGPLSPQKSPKKEDRRILHLAWAFRDAWNCSIVARDFLSAPSLDESPNALNVVMRAAVVEAPGKTTVEQARQLISSFWDTVDQQADAARTMRRARQFKTKQWMEIGAKIISLAQYDSLLAEGKVAENSRVDVYFRATSKVTDLLMRFAQDALQLVDSEDPSSGFPSSISPNSDFSWDKKSDGEASSILFDPVSTLQRILNIIQGENKASYMVMSRRRISAALQRLTEDRSREFDTALAWNSCHPGVKEITIVASQPEHAAYVENLRATKLPRPDKVNVILIAETGDRDVQFRELFSIANMQLLQQQSTSHKKDLESDDSSSSSGRRKRVTAVMHSDILLGEGFGVSKWSDPTFLFEDERSTATITTATTQDDMVVVAGDPNFERSSSSSSSLRRQRGVALSRRNSRANEDDFCSNTTPGGIDAFLFVPPIAHGDSVSLFQNEWFCEFKLIGFMCLKAKLQLYNPCEELQMYHFHLTEFRPNQHFPPGHPNDPRREYPLVGCPITRSGQDDKTLSAPCCDIQQKVFLPSEVMQAQAKAAIFLRPISLNMNNTVLQHVCFSFRVSGLIVAPERGHFSSIRARSIESGIFVPLTTPSPGKEEQNIAMCVDHIMPSGASRIALEVVESRERETNMYEFDADPSKVLASAELSVFLLKDLEDKNMRRDACQWVQQGNGLRRGGGLVDC